jgi:hypothetical protein
MRHAHKYVFGLLGLCQLHLCKTQRSQESVHDKFCTKKAFLHFSQRAVQYEQYMYVMPSQSCTQRTAVILRWAGWHGMITEQPAANSLRQCVPLLLKPHL